MQVENMGASASTDNMSIEGDGQLVEGTCTAGTVAIRGNFTVSGITNLTLSDDARIDVAQINAECDTALTDYDAVVPADLPTNFSDLAITVTTGLVSVGTNNDKTGYALSAAGVDAIWDELMAGHVTADSAGKHLADILADTAVIGAAGAGLTAIPWNAAWDAEVESEVLDALDVAISTPTAGSVWDVLNDLSGLLPVSGTLSVYDPTDALTEAYSTDGSAATTAELLYQIWSRISEFSISDTTITSKKLDGTTQAMTFTLDDGTNPTSVTRAT